VLSAARLASASQQAGTGDVNLNAIAAAVIGGTSPKALAVMRRTSMPARRAASRLPPTAAMARPQRVRREAARRAGIDVRRITASAFVLCSTFAALGGVLSAM
jgi:ABC-type xylose transport system permease subunit